MMDSAAAFCAASKRHLVLVLVVIVVAAVATTVAASSSGGGGGGGGPFALRTAAGAAHETLPRRRSTAFATPLLYRSSSSSKSLLSKTRIPPSRSKSALFWWWGKKKDEEKVATEYLNPLLWNPEVPNFEIIDWERFESTNPKPPKVYDPPQVDEHYEGTRYDWNWWAGRAPLFNLLPTPFNLVHQFNMRLGNHAKNGKRTVTYVNKDDFLIDMLRPEATSAACPDVLKGVIWTRDNIVPENCVTFSNWAWKSSAVNAGKRDKLKNKNGDGVIGVGSLGYNWSTDGSFFGFGFAYGGGNLLQGNVQMSPSGKWILLCFGRDFTKNDLVSYNYMYVVQEGDDFEVAPGDEDGPDQHKVKLQPGDLIRISWNDRDPYSNDNADISWMYVPRRIATWDEDSNSLVKIQPDLDDYRRRATSSDIYQGPRPKFFRFWSGNMSTTDRGEYVRKEMANRQYYTRAPRPPTPEEVDPL